MGPRTSREDEKSLYIKSQYKGTCTTCGGAGKREQTDGINKVISCQSDSIAKKRTCQERLPEDDQGIKLKEQQ